MGFRFQRRVSLGGGLGLNLSKSGVSPSYRTRYGSVSSRGFSFRTGIPGLTYRSGFGGRSKKGNVGDVILLLAAAFWLIMFAFYLLAKIFQFFMM